MRNPVTPSEVRFWPKVDKTEGGCWIWTAARDPNGYGRFWHKEKVRLSHRVAWDLLIGPIPDGLELDHLCRTPSCVNPDHLEPVSHKENMRRSPYNPRSVWAASRDRCIQGHEYTPENTYRSPKRPNARECRACRSEASERYHDRKIRGVAS